MNRPTTISIAAAAASLIVLAVGAETAAAQEPGSAKWRTGALEDQWRRDRRRQAALREDEPEEARKWREIARETLEARIERRTNHRRAKNVIVFWADGMGPTLAAAARIYQGQLRGEEGEENFLTFERFPYTGFVKTYSTDGQIPDSAATASAVMTGVKTHNGAVSVYAGAEDCATVPENLMETLRPSGRAIGVVTTTYITDASPASVYAHAPSRR
ncbi:MAG: hypothetical protein Tsb0010_15000 [Parvularculaceae bacterium]